MATYTQIDNLANPWQGKTTETKPQAPQVPAPQIPQHTPTSTPPPAQAPIQNQAPPPSGQTQGQPPGMDLFGGLLGGASPMQIPNYLGQAGGLFNNFQPQSLPGADFSGMFDGYQRMYDQIGPQIPVGDIIGPQMQDQMLNSAIGQNAAQRQSSLRDAVNRLGGRGFTSESPALQATDNRLALNEALANTQARTDIPIQTAKQNADYGLQAMQANLGQRNQDIQNFIGLENAKTGRISPLLQSLVGLV